MSYKGNSIFKGKFFVWLAALCFLVAPLLANTYMQSILCLVCFYAFAAVAWNLICGYAGHECPLGHRFTWARQGYISTILLETKGVSPWIGMLIGAAVAMLIGVVISYPTFRLKGPVFHARLHRDLRNIRHLCPEHGKPRPNPAQGRLRLVADPDGLSGRYV